MFDGVTFDICPAGGTVLGVSGPPPDGGLVRAKVWSRAHKSKNLLFLPARKMR